ncbi:hypothetical protein SAMN05428938_8234 [Streptomyces sp. KS_5]|nr:hypothetical protein SAMN05216482_9053 [Streptomyces sp. PAN_FS17]SEE70862.1 hypothetical protein SAMN05428938_8234 [Streptomyces sp. KS_5]
MVESKALRWPPREQGCIVIGPEYPDGCVAVSARAEVSFLVHIAALCYAVVPAERWDGGRSESFASPPHVFPANPPPLPRIQMVMADRGACRQGLR